ncbi:MAG TPA: aspartate-semialdehyde dehydrogenase [Kofleriaceae bacterium]|nr:aspartate-semialdehyde dehydrogenase [Kofleriaceae bacterium]
MANSNNQTRKARAAVVGATGLAGQQFLSALANHPDFEITALAASSRSAGKTYQQAITSDAGQIGWYAEGPLEARIAALPVVEARALDATRVDVVFSCVDAGPARELEPQYAQHAAVVSTASAHRYDDDVPVIVPGVNMEHIALLREQQQRRGWKGFITPNPNCTTVGLVMTLAPLYRAFGLEHVHMVSMQAVSGAGRSPGVIALDVIDNIVPYIPKEEEKVQKETLKILGDIENGAVKPARFGVSCTCTRVGVLEGHTEAVHLRLGKAATETEILAAWANVGGDLLARNYHSAPEALIHVHDDPFRPQVRLDRDRGGGMTTVVGRLRPDENTENGWKYLLVSHNTKMGAAKGCILLAEHLAAEGLIERGGN